MDKRFEGRVRCFRSFFPEMNLVHVCEWVCVCEFIAYGISMNCLHFNINSQSESRVEKRLHLPVFPQKRHSLPIAKRPAQQLPDSIVDLYSVVRQRKRAESGKSFVIIFRNHYSDALRVVELEKWIIYHFLVKTIYAAHFIVTKLYHSAATVLILNVERKFLVKCTRDEIWNPICCI